MRCSTCKRRPAEIGRACRQCAEYRHQYYRGGRCPKRPGVLRQIRRARETVMDAW